MIDLLSRSAFHGLATIALPAAALGGANAPGNPNFL